MIGLLIGAGAVLGIALLAGLLFLVLARRKGGVIKIGRSRDFWAVSASPMSPSPSEMGWPTSVHDCQPKPTGDHVRTAPDAVVDYYLQELLQYARQIDTTCRCVYQAAFQPLGRDKTVRAIRIDFKCIRKLLPDARALLVDTIHAIEGLSNENSHDADILVTGLGCRGQVFWWSHFPGDITETDFWHAKRTLDICKALKLDGVG